MLTLPIATGTGTCAGAVIKTVLSWTLLWPGGSVWAFVIRSDAQHHAKAKAKANANANANAKTDAEANANAKTIVSSPPPLIAPV